jgi:hypothetical protein
MFMTLLPQPHMFFTAAHVHDLCRAVACQAVAYIPVSKIPIVCFTYVIKKPQGLEVSGDERRD